MTNEYPTEGDLRVWYIPQVPSESYEVDIPRRDGTSESAYLEQAAFVLSAIIGLSIWEFDHRVKPDYSDAAGIARFDGEDWEDVDPDEYDA